MRTHACSSDIDEVIGMKKRKRDGELSLSSTDRRDVVSELASIRGSSRATLAKTLQCLQSRGMLVDPLVDAPNQQSYERAIDNAFETIALARTPYRNVLQEKTFANGVAMAFISPFALLYQLCSINLTLFGLIKQAVAAGPARILLYVDEVNPGNPLQPDPQKLLQAMYWTIPELPLWFLSRKDSWFCFGIIRSIDAKTLTGYMSEIFAFVVNVFFSEREDSFAKGVLLQNGSESCMLFANFGGVLGDEKALKEVFGIFGQAGNVPCISCLNVRNRWVNFRGDDSLQRHWDPDLSKRIGTTENDIREMCKIVSDPNLTNRKDVEKNLGLHYMPSGLLFCNYLMTSMIVQPTRHYIRDYMHTFCASGVAGTHIALIVQTIAAIGMSIDIVRSFAFKCTLPIRINRGRVSDLFFKPTLMSTDKVRHFAGDVMGMVTLMAMFLLEYVAPRGLISEHVECFLLLHTILCTLRRGRITASIRDALQRKIVRHAILFLKLYDNVFAKIKFHHTFHIPDDMYRLGKVLGCFTAERRNKDLLALASATSRQIAKSATMKFLHATISHWASSNQTIEECSMIKPTLYSVGNLRRSTATSLACGEVHASDFVLLRDGGIGQVACFWDRDDTSDIVVQLHKHKKLTRTRIELARSATVFQSVRDIVEAIAYQTRTKHNYMVIDVPDYCD
jgi:hypothetical protein